MHRRSFLATATIIVSGTALGTTAAGADEHGNGDDPIDDDQGVVRGESDAAVDVETEEDDEHVEYLEDEDEVQFVEAWQASDDPDEREDDEPPEREPVYTTTDWESWGQQRTWGAASTAAAEHVEDELDLEENQVGGSVTSNVSSDDPAVVISIRTEDEADPEASLDELAAITPSTVDATYHLDDQTYQYDVPVYARIDRIEEDLDDRDDLGGGDADPEPDGNESGEEEYDTPGESTDGNETGDGNESTDEGDEEQSDSVPGFGVLAAAGGIATVVAHRLKHR